MLTASQLAEIDAAVADVSRQGYGAVVIVIERGQPRRLRLEVDRSWGLAPDPERMVLESNSEICS